MKAKHKASFAVNDEPNIVSYAINFDNNFVSVPLIGVEIECGNEFERNVLPHWSKLLTPIGNSLM